jgi:peptidoglycan-associated lipoprotein
MLKKVVSISLLLAAVTACSGNTKSDYSSGLWLQGSGMPAELAPEVSNTVHFGFDKSTLSEEAKHTLDKQFAWWQGDKISVIIEGYTDDRGTREYNLALGERRAFAVKSYLVSKGIPADKIGTMSYGKERPAVIGENEEAWSMNRRAVTVLNKN